MKILLVQTPSVDSISSERVYPIGIVALATRLKQEGHEVSLFDMNLETDPFGVLKNRLNTERPQIVALSLRNIDPLANKTSSLVPQFTVTARLVKAVLPEATIIAGGTGFSLFPERLIAELPEIDLAIAGEAETGLPALLANLSAPGRIPGLCRRVEGHPTVEAPGPDYSFKDYLVPDRNLLAPERYKTVNAYAPVFGIETKRGCPLECAYCVYPALQGNRIRTRLPEDVVTEMAAMKAEFGIRDFHFNDPVVNMPGDHLESICEEILRRDLDVTWTGFFREDMFDRRKAELYARAGCSCCSFSPDGFSQASLEVLNKRLDFGDVMRAAEFAAETDIVTVYHFMVNVPGETDASAHDATETMERLYRMHARRRNLGAVVLNNIRLLPGTPITNLALTEGQINPETDLLYPVYYNPPRFRDLRYRLETLNLARNTFSWQGLEVTR